MTRLSAVLVTGGGPALLAWWCGRVREYADEIVIGLDARADDASEDAARRLADVVVRVELPGYADVARDWLVGRAGGDWILMFDDDETLPAGCGPALRALLEAPDVDSYGLPLRWVVRGPDGAPAWLRQHPWHTCHYTYLWRNDPSIAGVPGALHTAPQVVGPSVALDADGPVVLYHLDLAWRERATREAKVARYRALAGGDRPTGEEFYLPEDYADSLVWESLPHGEDLPLAVPAGPPALPGRPPVEAGSVGLEDLRTHLATRGLPSDVARSTGHPSMATVVAGPDPAQWAATYRLVEPFDATTTNRGDIVAVEVTNTSGATWATSGAPSDRVALSSRWVSAGWGAEVPQGDVTRLPRSLRPGETATVELGVWTPRLPGRYELVVDLLHEGHSWYSQHGVAPLRVPVTVTAGSAPMAVRHFVGRAADDAGPAGPAPGLVVPVAPRRLLDSRSGHGLVGVPIGPVRFGQPVVLHLAGHAGIPDDATGVVVAMTVVSDADGWASLWPTDGTTGADYPTVALRGDGNLCATSATVGLGVGRGHGRLSMAFGPGTAGTAQVTLDLHGYLVAPAGSISAGAH